MPLPARTWGLQPTGYVVPTYEELRARNVERLKLALRKRGLSDDVRTDPLSTLGKHVDFSTALHLEAHEEMGRMVAQLDFDSAGEPYLDNIGYLRGAFVRLDEEHSTAPFTIAGPPGLPIPAGAMFQLEGDPGVVFVTDAAATVPSGGSVAIACTATEPGAIDVEEGTEDWTVVNTFPGYDTITSITNGAVTVGRDVELNNAYRARVVEADSNSGKGTEGAIRRAIREVMNEGDRVIVRSNRTEETDAAGRPHHSFEVIVWSADTYPDQAIALAIWGSIPAGRGTYGVTKTATIVDSTGGETVITWSEAASVPIDVQVSGLVKTGEPSDYQDVIIEAVRAVIDALDPGDDVSHFAVLKAVLCLEWVDEVVVKLRRDSNPYAEAAVTIGEREKAVCNPGTNVTFA